MRATRNHLRGLARAAGLAALILPLSCGGEKPSGGGGGPAPSGLQAAFASASRESGVPARFLMAVGYLESRLAPQNATANYVALDNATDPVARGTVLTQTAFGLTFEELGLDPAREDSQVLEIQIKAYAAWLKTKLEGLALSASPRSAEDKYYWIENLASLHRQAGPRTDEQSPPQRRNVQIMFARELIQILNEGFVWQDPRTGQKLSLDREAPPVDPEKFPENGRAWLTLNELDADVRTATFLPLATIPTGELRNRPRRIEIVHCPLTLSGCLELHSRGAESDIHLQGHYFIPPFADRKEGDRTTGEPFSKIVQVVDHKDVVLLTNKRGESYPVTDALVVVLVGNSGRILAGERQPAIPTWFSDRQLRAMGQLVNDLCALLAQKTPSLVSYEHCVKTEGDLGVQFRHQGDSEEYRWGDVPDFDPTIFSAYVRNPGGLGTEVAYEFIGNRREFAAGEPITFNVLTNSTVRRLALERLSRCNGGGVVWEVVRRQELNGERRIPVREVLYDAGPNDNGEQYFRVRAYGADGRLIGWHINRITLRDYRKERSFASEEHCRPSR